MLLRLDGCARLDSRRPDGAGVVGLAPGLAAAGVTRLEPNGARNPERAGSEVAGHERVLRG